MHILLADDHAMVRDGLVPFLERVGPDVTVIEAASLEEALTRCAGGSDLALAILDLYMPGMDRLAGLDRFKAAFPSVPVLILSGSTKPDDAFAAIEAGAAGYIPKTMRGETIIGVLRLVLSGEKYVPPFLFEHRDMVRSSAEQAEPTLPPGSPIALLTPRERDILNQIVDGAPNKVIARALDLQEVTVKAHLRNMFRKLGVANRTEAARIALMAGISGNKASSGRPV
ncbi:putative Glycerol metabolism activator [Magnetospirillum sp. LM-5]|uniref:LuxR C-terminal-related transcriptional regulator n=1 Tax=Magnetospirillum sp. LM-5 TaxID=2681466 RepID=UPI001384874B|nr:response regulator transcription factor [Magnetospirillum sp. LM-5]CAA7612021.1 putative Glycerol metabolism activator [Magnetospirillum sp. LM-5]